MKTKITIENLAFVSEVNSEESVSNVEISQSKIEPSSSSVQKINALSN